MKRKMASKPKTTTASAAKRKPFVPPEELQDYELSDTDIIDGSINDEELKFINEQGNAESKEPPAIETSSPMDDSFTTSGLQEPTGTASNAEEPTHQLTSAYMHGSPAADKILNEEAAETDTKVSSESNRTAGMSTAGGAVTMSSFPKNVSGAVTDVSKGAISKTKAAFKQYDSNIVASSRKEAVSWYDEVQNHQASSNRRRTAKK